MSISFGGQASGVDTTAWIEALVQMKQATLDTYQAKKETLEQTTSILDNVKSFFASFKSVLTNVTNSNLGIASFDLFIQNLVETTNAEVATASVTTEAEQANYEIYVDQVATETEALSSYQTNIISTTETIATHNSLLSSIGIGTGKVEFNVGGMPRTIILQSNDTIGSFVDKLNKIGVDASYDAEHGFFSINLGLDDINDIDNTGIKNALFLQDVNSGYSSDLLELFSNFTNVIKATEGAKMSLFGVTDGTYTLTDQEGNDFIFEADIDKSFREFFDQLAQYGIIGGFDEEGVIHMTTNSGYTISGALAVQLGIDKPVDNTEQTDTKAASTIGAFSTEVMAADYTSTLGEIGAVTSNGNDKLIIANAHNSIIAEITTLEQDSTVDDLFATLAQYGIAGSLENSVITLNSVNGNIIGGEIAENLGINTFQESTTTINTGETTTSTSMISYVASATDFISDCLWDVWDSYSDEDKVIYVSHADRYSTVVETFTVIEKNSIASDGSVLRGTQFQDLANWYKSLDPTSTFVFNNNGQIFIDSNDCFYFEGTIADYLGIGTHIDTYTWTEGITTTTSYDGLSYRVRKTDHIADTLWDNGWQNYSAEDKVISAYSMTVDHTKDNEYDDQYQHTVKTLVGTFTIIESQTSVREDGTTTTLVQGTTYEDLSAWFTTTIDKTATFLINNDGTITIDSDDTFFLEGRALDDLGIGKAYVYQSWTTGTESTESTACVTYAAKATDYIADTFTSWDWENVNKTIAVYTSYVDHANGNDGNGTYQETIQTKLTDIVIDRNTTFNSFFEQLKPYSINMSMTSDGIIRVDSSVTNYLVEENGGSSMLDHFGIRVDSVYQTWTTGTESTESTKEIQYYAKMTDYISDTFTANEWGWVNKDIVVNRTYVDHENHHTVITQVTTIVAHNTMTFNELASRLAEYGMTLDLEDGILTIDSDPVTNLNNSTYYITGAIPNHYGIKIDEVEQSWTTGTESTESTDIVQFNASMTDYISDTFRAYDWNNLDSYTNTAYVDDGQHEADKDIDGHVISVMHAELDHTQQHTVISTATLITITTQTTFNQLAETLSHYGITLDIQNGVVMLDSNAEPTLNNSNYYIEGSIPRHYGVYFNTINQNWTTGTASTESTSDILYNVKMTDYLSDTMTESYWKEIDKNIVIKHTELDHSSHQTVITNVTTIVATDTMTFNSLAATLKHDFDIDLNITDGGVLTLDSDCYYITGEIADYYGMTYNTLEQNWTTGTEETVSQGTISFKASMTDYLSDTFTAYAWSHLNSYYITTGVARTTTVNGHTTTTIDHTTTEVQGTVISVMHSELNHDSHDTITTRATSITITTDTTFQDLATALSTYGITLTIGNDGIVQMDSAPVNGMSNSNFYIVGTIPDYYGISYLDKNQNWTTGAQLTQSTSENLYNAKMTDFISDTFKADHQNRTVNANNYTGETLVNEGSPNDIITWSDVDKNIYIHHSELNHTSHIVEDTIVGTITVNDTMRFNDLAALLAQKGVTLSMTTTGAIRLDSDCNYITGEIPDYYGITYNTQFQYWTTGTEETVSGGNVDFAIQLTDYISDAFTADDWNSLASYNVTIGTVQTTVIGGATTATVQYTTTPVNGSVISVLHNELDHLTHQTVTSVATYITITTNTTFQNLKDTLANYGISLTINDGVICMDSNDVAGLNDSNFYIVGSIPDHFGITYNTIQQTWTYGTDTTGNAYSYKATMTDYIADTFTATAWNNLASYSNTAGERNIAGNVISVMHAELNHLTHQTVITTKTLITVTTDTTFEGLKNTLSTFGISLTINDGVVTLDSNAVSDMSNSAFWIEGTIPNHYGVTYNTIQQTWTYGTDKTSNAYSFTAKMTDYISDTMTNTKWNSIDKNIVVNRTYLDHLTQKTVIAAVTTITATNTMTFNSLAADLATHGITLSMTTTGVVTLDSDCYYVTGAIPEYFGMTVNTLAQTWTYGTDTTGNAYSYKSSMTDYIADTYTATAWNNLASYSNTAGETNIAGNVISVMHAELNHRTHQTVITRATYITVTYDTTFDNLKDTLANYGITLGMTSSGAVTLDSNPSSGNAYWIEGTIPNHFGVTYNTIQQTWTHGTNTTSSNYSYKASWTDYICDAMTINKWENQINNGTDNLLLVHYQTINHDNHSVSDSIVGTITVTESTTFDNLKTF